MTDQTSNFRERLAAQVAQEFAPPEERRKLAVAEKVMAGVATAVEGEKKDLGGFLPDHSKGKQS